MHLKCIAKLDTKKGQNNGCPQLSCFYFEMLKCTFSQCHDCVSRIAYHAQHTDLHFTFLFCISNFEMLKCTFSQCHDCVSRIAYHAQHTDFAFHVFILYFNFYIIYIIYIYYIYNINLELHFFSCPFIFPNVTHDTRYAWYAWYAWYAIRMIRMIRDTHDTRYAWYVIILLCFIKLFKYRK